MFQPIYTKDKSILMYFKVYTFTGNRVQDGSRNKLQARVWYKKTLDSQCVEVIETWERDGLNGMKYKGKQPMEVREALWNHLWESNHRTRLFLASYAFWDWKTA